MQSLFILGRQPALGLAELESLYGADKITPVGNVAALVDIEPAKVKFARLGGMIKFCKVLTTLDTTNWREIQKFLENVAPGHAREMPEGKLRLGLSVYDINVNQKQMMATGLELKKLIKKDGRSVRYVPNVEPALNSAQVLHNQLTQKLGWELIFVRSGSKTIVAQSIAVQDIDRYAARDQGRPKRDARVGMLPPKLAQTIVNLATSETGPEHGSVVLDPFCGTGVVLQEASLMGYDIYGSDLDQRMVDYTDENLLWLADINKNLTVSSNDGRYYHLEKADATDHIWSPPPNFIACETFLGRPLSSLPDRQTMQKIVQDCATIHTKFLKNVAKQTKPGFRLCIAVPAWSLRNGFVHLPTLDNLSSLGYNRIKFVHVEQKDLIYHRPGQIVARELVVLERK